MEMSTAINELAAAMAKAQAEMTGAKKDAENPFFKHPYADLASVRAACLPQMTKYGLSVWQFPRYTIVDGFASVEIETIILHESGQFMKDTLMMPVNKPDAQGVGSAISYGRRYALASITSVAPEDDDGEGAIGRGDAPSGPPSPSRTSPPPRPAQRRPPVMATPAAPAQTGQTPEPGPTPHGRIAKAIFREQGSLITLDNGFVCGTREDVLFNEAARLRDLYKQDPKTAPIVDLEVRAPRTPEGAFKLLKIQQVSDAH